MEHVFRRRLAAVIVGAVVAMSVAVAPSAPADVDGVPARSRVYDRVADTAGCGTPAGSRVTDGDVGDWPAVAGGVTGTGYHAGGEYVWTDYVADDAGTGELVYPGEGDLLVPADDGSVGTISPMLQRYGGSAADIVEARFAADEELLHVLLVFSFLNASDTTVATVGIDVDGDEQTGEGSWPLGAGLLSPGADVFVTAHPTPDGFCATVSDAGGDRPLDAAGGAAAVNTVTNAIEVTVPLDALGIASTDHVGVVAGSGLWDIDSGQWKRPIKGAKSPIVPEELRAGEADDVRGGLSDADPGVFNLLFRGDEPMIDLGNATDAASSSSKRAFEFSRQAAVLQTGTSGPYRLDLDLGRIAPGASAEPAPTRRGDLVEFTRQYRSRVDLEGLLWVENDISRDIIYLGSRQSYAVHLPPCLAGGDTVCPADGVPLAVTFHGGSGSHVNELESFTTSVAGPMADAAEVLTLAPFGRGRRAPWWRGLGELDVLEALADAEAAYPIDPDRRLAYGGSLGGYATLRFSSLYPDLWAGAAAYCPATYENSTSTREPGNELPETQQFTVFPLLGSLVNTPLLQVSGTIDPLVRIDNGRRLRDAAMAEGLDVRYTEWFNGQHCTWVPETTQRFPDWHVPEMLALLERGRATAPAVVRYASDPRHLLPGAETLGVAHLDDIGVRHDRAWWVSAIQVRDDVIAAAAETGTDLAGNTIGGPGDDVVGRVTAVSHALEGWQRVVETCGDEIGLAGVSGNPEVQQRPGDASGMSIPEPHHFLCQRQLRATPALEPVLDLSAVNLAAVTVDRAAAGLGRAFELRATGDGDLDLTVVGSRAASGDCVLAQRAEPGRVIVSLRLDADPCVVAIGDSLLARRHRP